MGASACVDVSTGSSGEVAGALSSNFGNAALAAGANLGSVRPAADVAGTLSDAAGLGAMRPAKSGVAVVPDVDVAAGAVSVGRASGAAGAAAFGNVRPPKSGVGADVVAVMVAAVDAGASCVAAAAGAPRLVASVGSVSAVGPSGEGFAGSVVDSDVLGRAG